MAITNASDETYTTCRNAILRCYPDSGVLSHHSIKKLIAEITGVVAVYDDMCINSCHAFTGPFSQLETCTICGETRYDAVQLASTRKKVPRQRFCTILLGPQLQALRRSHAGALDMCYLDQKMKEVAEMLSGLIPCLPLRCRRPEKAPASEVTLNIMAKRNCMAWCLCSERSARESRSEIHAAMPSAENPLPAFFSCLP